MLFFFELTDNYYTVITGGAIFWSSVHACHWKFFINKRNWKWG